MLDVHETHGKRRTALIVLGGKEESGHGALRLRESCCRKLPTHRHISQPRHLFASARTYDSLHLGLRLPENTPCKRSSLRPQNLRMNGYSDHTTIAARSSPLTHTHAVHPNSASMARPDDSVAGWTMSTSNAYCLASFKIGYREVSRRRIKCCIFPCSLSALSTLSKFLELSKEPVL